MATRIGSRPSRRGSLTKCNSTYATADQHNTKLDTPSPTQSPRRTFASCHPFAPRQHGSIPPQADENPVSSTMNGINVPIRTQHLHCSLGACIALQALPSLPLFAVSSLQQKFASLSHLATVLHSMFIGRPRNANASTVRLGHESPPNRSVWKSKHDCKGAIFPMKQRSFRIDQYPLGG